MLASYCVAAGTATELMFFGCCCSGYVRLVSIKIVAGARARASCLRPGVNDPSADKQNARSHQCASIALVM